MEKIEHYCQISKFWFFESALLLSDRFWDDILYVYSFFLPNHFKNTVSMFMKNYKEISLLEGA